MAKILIAGSALVIKSGYSLDEIKTLEKYRPKALTIFEEDGKTELFKVGTTKGDGSIGTFGASFGRSSADDDKKATITIDIPADVTDAKKYAEDTVGVAIVYLNKVEDQIPDALASVEEERAKVRENIVAL